MTTCDVEAAAAADDDEDNGRTREIDFLSRVGIYTITSSGLTVRW